MRTGICSWPGRRMTPDTAARSNRRHRRSAYRSECDFSVAGTLFGRNHLRLVDVDGVEMDAIPQGHILFIKNDDTPGVVGHLGTVLGERSINIARMTVGRKPGSSRAVMIIEFDSPVPSEVASAVAAIPGVREARAISLEPAGR